MTSGPVIRMPQLGLTMTEGMVVEWCVAPGQPIAKGAILVIVETDKIANEVTADRDGMLADIIVAAGETVPVGAVLGHWTGGAETSAVAGSSVVAAPIAASAAVTSPSPMHSDTRVIATPHARKLARTLGLAVAQIAGSGPKGRIKADDVRRHAERAPAPAAGTTRPAAPRSRQHAIANRMQQAKRDIPHFYLTANADISELDRSHRRLKLMSAYAGLTLTHWLVSAAGLALEEKPRYRSVWRDDDIVVLDDSDVAVAVALDDGLMAPVARRVGRRGLQDNMTALCDLTARARRRELRHDEVVGGTLCVSNLGSYDLQYVAPIIIPGQSAILGVGRTQEVFRPDAERQPSLKHELGLVLACDHRVLNGADGAELLTLIIHLLQDPLRILAEPRRSA